MSFLNIQNLHLQQNKLSYSLYIPSFHLEKPDVYGLIGPSGSGKTQFVRSLFYLSFVHATCKNFLFQSQDFTKQFNKQQRFCFHQQSFLALQNARASLHPTIRIKQQLFTYYKHIHGKDVTNMEENIANILKAVHIYDKEAVLQQFPHQLSLGTCQRIQLAFLLISRSKFWILDEITSALDPILETEILEILMELQKTMQSCILMISHNQALLNFYCKEILSFSKLSSSIDSIY